ncbi:MAG: hypothetical protein M3Q50_11695 [Chloroflexota bacterium]|nr:hypothetical protein [Chloroflexia bacterium]MDQ3227279.1 hypothetical protein [Chloroflexota bacterium]
MQLKLLMVLAMMGVTTLPGSAVHAQSDTPTPGSAGTADCTGLEPRDAEYFQA